MTLRISNIDRFKNQITFKSENDPKTPLAQQTEEPKDEESFYDRNKNTILALSALGVAGISIALIRHYTLPDVGKAGRELTNNVNKSVDQKLGELWQFLSNNKNCDAEIEKVLQSDEPEYKLKGIEYIALRNHVTPQNWEKIFDSLLTIKPVEKSVSEGDILGSSRMFLYKLCDNGILNPEVFDKISEKTVNLPLNTRLNFLNSIISNSKLSKKQIKDVLSYLDTISQKEFQKLDSWSTENVPLEKLKMRYIRKYFEDLSVDQNYIEEFSKFLKNDRFSNSAKLDYIEGLDLYKLGNDKKTKDGIRLYKIIMETIQGIDDAEYQTYIGAQNTYELGFKIFRNIKIYDKFNICSSEELLKYIKHIKKLSKVATNNTGEYLNAINNAEIRLKCELFDKNFSGKTTIEDIEKYVDELLEDFKYAKENYVKNEDNILENYEESDLKFSFKSLFAFDVSLKLYKIQINNLYNPENIYRISEASARIENKINSFGEKYFDIKSHKSNSHTKSGYHSGGHNYNPYDFVRYQTEQAKLDIIEFLSDNQDFKEILEKLRTQELNKDIVKTLKKRVAVKYHPDRFATESEDKQKKATADFQKIKNLIEILEKAVK